MAHVKCFPRIALFLLWAVVFIMCVAGGVLWTLEDLYSFFMTRPSVNTIIVILGLLGLLISMGELIRLLLQGISLDSLATDLLDDSKGGVEEIVRDTPRGPVKDRCMRTVAVLKHGLAARESLSLLSEADSESEESRGAFVRYLVGVMVFLGLIGTFWGVLLTVSGVQKILEALEPARIEDPVAFLGQLKSSMGGLLGGLSTAFSTSLFGLGGSVVLGFVELQTRKARSLFLAELDRFVAGILVPRVPIPVSSPIPLTPERSFPKIIASVGEQFFRAAEQETFGETLRKLAEVLELQAGTDEKMTASLVEIKRILETLKEEDRRTREDLHSANLARQNLLERVEDLGRHTEALIMEIRLGRESSHSTGKAILERLKIENEITNKTLSRGFSDLLGMLSTLSDKTESRGEGSPGSRE